MKEAAGRLHGDVLCFLWAHARPACERAASCPGVTGMHPGFPSPTASVLGSVHTGHSWAALELGSRPSALPTPAPLCRRPARGRPVLLCVPRWLVRVGVHPVRGTFTECKLTRLTSRGWCFSIFKAPYK